MSNIGEKVNDCAHSNDFIRVLNDKLRTHDSGW